MSFDAIQLQRRLWPVMRRNMTGRLARNTENA